MLVALVVELDDEDFIVRQRAMQALAGLGQAARETLRTTAERAKSPEAAGRAKELLRRLDSDAVAPERRRSLRAVALLEWSGAPAAAALLAALAKGAPDAQLTRAAQAAVTRLKTR
jgi:hypothetical protein